MADLAELTLKINSRRAEDSVERLTKKLNKLENVGLAVGRSMQRVGAAMTVAITAPVLLAGRAAVRASAEFEQARIAFGVFVGDMGKGARLFKDLQEFSARTPLTLGGLSNASQMLLATGTAAKDLKNTLLILGNASRGNNDILQRLALNLGQVAAQGKLTGRELRDFAMAAVPIKQVLADMFNTTTGGVQDLVAKGKVGFDSVLKAFQKMSAEGGIFSGMLDKMSQTLAGKWTTAIDNVKIALASLVDPIRPQLKEVLDQIIMWSKKIAAISTENKKLIVSVLAIAAALGPILVILGTIIVAISKSVIAAGILATVWPAIVAAIIPLTLALIKVIAVIGLISLAINEVRKMFGVTWKELGIGLLSFAKKTIGFFMNFRANWAILMKWLTDNQDKMLIWFSKAWRAALFNVVHLFAIANKNMLMNFTILMDKMAAVAGTVLGWIFSGQFFLALGQALEGLSQWADAVINGIVKLGKNITKIIGEALIGAFTGEKVELNLLKSFREGFKRGFVQDFGLADRLADFHNDIGGVITKALTDISKGRGFSTIWKDIKEGFNSALKGSGTDFFGRIDRALKGTRKFVKLMEGAQFKGIPKFGFGLPKFITDIFKKDEVKFSLDLVPHGPEGPGVPGGPVANAIESTRSGKAAEALEAGTREALKLASGVGSSDPAQKARQDNLKANKETAKSMRLVASQGVRLRGVATVENFA